MPRRAILLGASGFIGRALHRRLSDAGGVVHAFSSRTLDMRRPAAFKVLDSLLGPETDVIDLAGITPDRGATSTEGFLANVTMTLNLAAYLATQAARSCVFLSSDAVYGSSDAPVDEMSHLERLDERLPRTNLYVASKLASERALAAMADQAHVPLLVLRPCAVFGAGDTHDAYGPNRFVRTIVRERNVQLFGQGEELRDHIHVEDLVKVIDRLLTEPHEGIFNIATGTTRTFAAVVEVLRTMAPPFSVENLPRTRPIRHRSYDISRLLRAMPDVRFASFEERLRQTLDASG